MLELTERHASWEQRMPEDPAGLWAFIVLAVEEERLALLAHCLSLTLDTAKLVSSQRRRASQCRRHCGSLGSRHERVLATDCQQLSRSRRQDANRQAVRGGVSPEAAQTLDGLKKGAMAERAEKLLAGHNWLPEVRTPVE